MALWKERGDIIYIMKISNMIKRRHIEHFPYSLHNVFQNKMLSFHNCYRSSWSIWMIIYYSFLYRLNIWYVAARRFLLSTVSLISKVLHPPKEKEAVIKQKNLIKSKKKKRKGKRHAGRSAERERPSESVYQHYFIKFAELFFLENTYVRIYVCWP